MIAVPTYADVIPPAPGPVAVAQNPERRYRTRERRYRTRERWYRTRAAERESRWSGAAGSDIHGGGILSWGAELTLLAPATQSQNLLV